MSANPFERRIAEWLRSVDCWVYHPPDVPMRKLWAPADFLVVYHGRFTAIECKSIQTGTRFPLSGWTPQQRQACVDVTKHVGIYILLVNYAEPDVVAAFFPKSATVLARGSLPVESGRLVTKQTIHNLL